MTSSGPSCSGKTVRTKKREMHEKLETNLAMLFIYLKTLSLILKNSLKNVIVISQDAYFKVDYYE
jgi:uridine kinase